MALSRIDVTDGSGEVNSLTLTFGTAPAAGDIIVVFAGTKYGASISTPAGYTSLGLSNAASGSLRVGMYTFWKLANGSETDVALSANGAPSLLMATSVIYRGDNLAISTLMTDNNTVSGSGVVNGPDWASLPAADVAAICAVMSGTGASSLTGLTVGGSGWTERSDEALDVGAGGYHHGSATNTTETLAVCQFTFVSSSPSSNVPATAMVFVYESSGGARTGLMMSL